MNAMTLHQDETFASEINQDYIFLKTLTKIVGKPIKLDDLGQMKCKTFPDRDFIVLVHEPLNINKLVHNRKLQTEYAVRPESLSSFLYDNGAAEVDPTGHTVCKPKIDPLVARSQRIQAARMVPRTKYVWMQNSRGFWKKVLSEGLSLEQLRLCSAAS
ncbi:hypothetical protein [Geomesophilobacter sediminis]|uniref:Uncharacterized protein n=1 Tax=Geomesophilobacter sediminis TaxID=2798584 RepID=A0A8J7SC56_9BACT|nr:hypothetical protein [Geomesophilobacter sediminis]MBJ6726839.1 hypothetical protein [Geomesophilobacter sediminis]